MAGTASNITVVAGGGEVATSCHKYGDAPSSPQITIDITYNDSNPQEAVAVLLHAAYAAINRMTGTE